VEREAVVVAVAVAEAEVVEEVARLKRCSQEQ